MSLLAPRRVAAVAVGAVIAATLTALGATAPASAHGLATSAPEWEISPYFDEHLADHVLTDGATEADDGVITFPGGVADVDADGVARIAYDGSVAASFMTYYTVTVADPIVTVDPDGDGEISAVVSASNVATGMGPAASTEPTRVVVTTFSVDGWTADAVPTVAATPDWAGVLPEGPESVALGIGAGKPVDGQSFAPEFLGQLTPGVQGLFYATGSPSDAKKAPAAFSSEPVKAVSTDVSYDRYGVTIGVEGSGFTPTDGYPSDVGIYIGLAPAGGMPDVDDQQDMSRFAAANLVSGASIVDSNFASTMTAAGKDLRPGVEYSVYTWRAHEHSTTSQDTETPVTINWSKLKLALKTSWSKKPTTKKGGTLVVTGSGSNGKPVGTVKVVLTKSGKKISPAPAPTKAGKATVTVPKLKKGAWKVSVSYAGSNYTKATKTLTYQVR